MADDTAASPSRLLEYLPSIYRESPTLGPFLLAFEKVLLGRQDKARGQTDNKKLQDLRDLEQVVARLADFFDPSKTRKEFLPWLAGWVAFSLRADVDEEKQREFIANMTELYRWRGTKNNLTRLFHIFTDREPTFPDISDNTDSHYFKVLLDVSELLRGGGEGYDLRLMSVAAADGLVNEGRNLVIVALVGTDLHIRIFDASGNKVVDKAENELVSGETLTALKKQLTPIPGESGLSKEHKRTIIGDATSIAGHTGAETEADRQKTLNRQMEIAHALIRLEKPAHTRYTLDFLFPSFRIGSLEAQTKFHTQVGTNTRLGVAEWEK